MPKIGDKGEEVKLIQEELNLTVDGTYGPLTKKAVEEFQAKNGLLVDGIAGDKTLKIMFPSTDLKESKSWIEPYYLPKGEYREGPTNKEYIFIHHTAGWNNPYKVIDQWARDTRGRIATQYVIGGPHPRSGEEKYDGVVIECFKDENWGYHLGKNGSPHMHSHSVGIEVCNFGPLTKKGDKFYTWAGNQVDYFEVTQLETPWRGYEYWHSYSEDQISSLERLIKYISDIHSIDISIGLKNFLSKEDPYDAFEYKNDCFYGKVKGILSHSNIRKDKTDMYPHPLLIEMLKSL